MRITESGMEFGPFPDDHCFHIESSDVYDKVRTGVKMAEFLLLRPADGERPRLWVVEAKSSAPQLAGAPQRFQEFIAEVRDKLLNAFSLGWACCLDRHPETRGELPASFQELNLSRAKVQFVLVIRDHDRQWLFEIESALAKALEPTVKTWALEPGSVMVINAAQAKRYQLVS